VLNSYIQVIAYFFFFFVFPNVLLLEHIWLIDLYSSTLVITALHAFLQVDLRVITPKPLANILSDIKLIVHSITTNHDQSLHLSDIEEFLKLTFLTK